MQLDLNVAGESDLEVRIGEASSTPSLALAPVADTLIAANGEQGPRVWALLPAAWLASSGVAGPLLPESDVAGMPISIWSSLCDCDTYDVDSFQSLKSDGAVWLYDRGTAMYRGYARRGALSPLRSAYLETSIYRNAITGTGTGTRNGVPTKANDLKYAYAQNLALHYLFTGDDRFRESAEDMALGVTSLWNDPTYDGSDGFWTERHAGFGLLAYVWAGIVSDDRAAQFRALADAAVDAAIADQDTYPSGYASADARCFAHTVVAHGESTDRNFMGCSPWMSAILADGLDEYARTTDAGRAARVRSALVKLGTVVARRGLIPGGPPYYFMGIDSSYNMVNPDDGVVGSESGDSWDYEHVGEAAYLVAMAWHYGGRTDATLRATADSLVAMLSSDGGAPHMRSFNWQCRSAVSAPSFLK